MTEPEALALRRIAKAAEELEKEARCILDSPVSWGDERLHYDERQVEKSDWNAFLAGTEALSAALSEAKEKR